VNAGKVSGIGLRHDLLAFAKQRQKRGDRIARSDLRSEIDFETNVLSEVWLEALANHLGLGVNQVYATAHDRINQARAQAATGRPDPGQESPQVRPGA
jgi:hypothetical protein